jgi:hypothetical protein
MGFYRGPNIITDGLVLYLDAANQKSYPGAGAVWNDLSNQGNGGTLTNGPTFDSSNNGSIQFDGVDDYITLGNIFNDIIAGPGKQFTIVCSFSPKSTTNRVLIGKYSDSGVGENGRQFAIFARDLGAGFKVDVIFSTNLNGFVNIVRSDTTLSINENYILTVTYDDTQSTSLNKVNIYINGILSGKTIPFTGTFGPIATGPAQFGIGSSITSTSNTTYHYSGKVFNAMLYDHILSTDKILQNYNATKSRFNL